MKRALILTFLTVTVGLLGSLPSIAIGSVGNGGVARSLALDPSVHVPGKANTSSANQPQTAVTPGFTYQGSLKDGANPANGQYDFTFALYDDLTTGNQVGSTITMTNQTVTNGLFTLTLDFGSPAFQGDARWLQIAVRPAGQGGYTPLSPRQALTAAPYALGLRPGATISGTVGSSVVTVNNTGGGNGLNGTTTSGSSGVAGVRGESTGSNGTGVWGLGGNLGVYGSSTDGLGVYGIGSTGVWGASSVGDGVHGSSNTLNGVSGMSFGGNGVYGTSISGYAGWFDGNVRITGSCCGMGEATTQIDDPLDPANKYLNQSLVASPDMLEVYRGHVTLDANGSAAVQLPPYFEALNRDFDYQLTPIGAPMPNLYVAQEVQGNTFKIAGGKPGSKVSWQVTGVRQDAYATAHPIQPEQVKPTDEKGKYLQPQELGKPVSQGVDYDKTQRAQQPQQAGK